jgi:hypothetical protein
MATAVLSSIEYHIFKFFHTPLHLELEMKLVEYFYHVWCASLLDGWSIYAPNPKILCSKLWTWSTNKHCTHMHAHTYGHTESIISKTHIHSWTNLCKNEARDPNYILCLLLSWRPVVSWTCLDRSVGVSYQSHTVQHCAKYQMFYPPLY